MAPTKRKASSPASKYGSFFKEVAKIGSFLLNPSIEGAPSSRALAKNMADALFPTEKAAAMRRKGGRTRSARFGGKLKAKSWTRKKAKSKRSTRLQLQTKGICYEHEIRYTQTEVASPTPNTTLECVAVGHNSLPTKLTHANLWRAVLKMVCTKLGLHIRALTNTLTTFGFTNGDAFRINYYADSATATLSNLTLSVGATSTFDDLANAMAGQVRNITNLCGVMRWDTIDFVPTTGSKYRQINIRLDTVKVEIESASYLKVQNRTLTTVGDNEADDIDNVPLQGKFYRCKGNNVLHTSNRALLPQVAYDTEVALYYKTERAIAGSVTNNEVPDAPISKFLKQAEPPQPYELKNCFKNGKVRINPGEIKTSVLKHHKIYNFVQLINILSFGNGLKSDAFLYNSRCGETNTMYLEKVIGNNSTSVLIAYEVDFKQWIACTGSMSQISEPLQIQETF